MGAAIPDTPLAGTRGRIRLGSGQLKTVLPTLYTAAGSCVSHGSPSATTEQRDSSVSVAASVAGVGPSSPLRSGSREPPQHLNCRLATSLQRTARRRHARAHGCQIVWRVARRADYDTCSRRRHALLTSQLWSGVNGSSEFPIQWFRECRAGSPTRWGPRVTSARSVLPLCCQP